jgi:hypothetical protein
MARSLSLVSRYINNASQTVRFQSIICRDAVQILGFAAVLDRTPPRHRIVRHLLMTCSSHDFRNANTSGTKPSHISHLELRFRTASQPLMSRLALRPAERAVTFDMLMSTYRRALATVPRILKLAAPTLNSLSLHFDWPSSELFFPSHLPALVELSITQPWACGHLRSKELHQLVSCPSLRRLVLNGFAYADDPVKIIGCIQRFAPSLTHLCLPLEPTNSMPLFPNAAIPFSLLSRLQELMNQPIAPEDAAFPKTLEVLVLHDRKFINCDGPWLGDPRFVIVGRSWEFARSVGPLALQWERQWLDGISGGQGFWEKPSVRSRHDGLAVLWGGAMSA